MLHTRPSRRDFMHATAVTAAASAALAQAPAPRRPSYRLTEPGTFDPRAVPAYAGHHERIYAYMMYDVQPVDPADWTGAKFDGRTSADSA